MPGIEHHLIKNKSYVTEFVTDPALIDLGCVYLNKKRLSQNTPLAPGDYLRVHTMPRRFPCSNIDWNKTVVFENENLLIIAKPAGIPVHPTLDNQIENVLYQSQKYLGILLFHTHRLDIGTQGLLILAKNKAAQTQVNSWFFTQQIKKTYKAVVKGDPALGHWVHYMKNSPRAPKELSKAEKPGWLKCEMVVNEKANHELGTKLHISLITGRSHQIRAQLSFEGFPILGDTLYGSTPLAPYEVTQQECCVTQEGSKTPSVKKEFYHLKCVALEIPQIRKITLP